jgi:hypothetical protein
VPATFLYIKRPRKSEKRVQSERLLIDKLQALFTATIKNCYIMGMLPVMMETGADMKCFMDEVLRKLRELIRNVELLFVTAFL